MKLVSCRVCLYGVGFLLVAATGCVAKERHTVQFSYVIAPQRPLPEGLKAVAVIDSGVNTEGQKEDDREKKWSTIAADMIEAMVQNGSQQYGVGLGLAKRRETRQVLAEQDMRLAGLVDAPTAARAGKLLAVQGLIVSRINIRIDIRKGTKSTVDWLGLMGQVAGQMRETRTDRPGPPPPQPRPDNRPRNPYVRRARDPRNPRYQQDPNRVYSPAYTQRTREKSTSVAGGMQIHTKEVEEIARSLTVQCSFSLIDVMTGEAIAQYAPPPIQKNDKKSPHFLFGSNMDEADLDPVDLFIGELLERATRDFVGVLVPVQIQCSYEIEGRGKEGEAAVRLIRADDFAGAIRLFGAALAKKEEHQNIFAMGVAYELAGDRVNALQCYRRASAAKGVDKDDLPVYLAAKERLTQHIDRILVPGPKQPAASAPPAGAAPAAAPAAPTSQPAAGWHWDAPK